MPTRFLFPSHDQDIFIFTIGGYIYDVIYGRLAMGSLFIYDKLTNQNVRKRVPRRKN